MSRALSILQSSNITISDFDINNSMADYNHLIYLSQAKDIQISNFKILNVTKF